MAGLAGHVHFGPARIEAVGLRVVALLETGGVTGDAHGVGRLVAAGPVQHVAGRRRLVRQQVEPLAFARVPGNLQRLQPALAGVDQVLLQRFVAEGVGDLEVGHAAIGAVGVHHVLVAAPEEARGHALVPELRVVEVAAHRLRCRRGHGLGMVRRRPGLAGRLVAAQTLGVFDIGGRRQRCGHRCRGRARSGRRRAAREPQPGRHGQCDQQQCRGPQAATALARRHQRATGAAAAGPGPGFGRRFFATLLRFQACRGR